MIRRKLFGDFFQEKVEKRSLFNVCLLKSESYGHKKAIERAENAV